MLLSVLLAACALGLATAVCSPNPDGSCVAPQSSTCVSPCLLRLLNTSCLALPGCTWNETDRCRPANSSLVLTCASQTLSADCGAIAGCHWYVEQCPTVQACVPGNNSITRCTNIGTNATACAALSPQCQMGNYCVRSKLEECSLKKDNQASCTATAGCFWASVAVQTPNETETSTTCGACLLDPVTNYYYTYRDLVGKTCTVENSTSSMRGLQAIPAATGCAGGQPFSLNAFGGTQIICSGAGLTAATSSSFAVAVVVVLATFLA